MRDLSLSILWFVVLVYNLSMRIIVFCSFLILLASCGDPAVSNRRATATTSLSTASVFSPYVRAFNDGYRKYSGRSVSLANMKIQMVESLPGDVIGQCYPSENRVVVSRAYWNAASESERQALIFHELGHCELGRRHVSTKIGAQPVSLMFPILDEPIRYFGAYRSEYIEELFTARTEQFGPSSSGQQRSLQTASEEDLDDGICNLTHL